MQDFSTSELAHDPTPMSSGPVAGSNINIHSDPNRTNVANKYAPPPQISRMQQLPEITATSDGQEEDGGYYDVPPQEQTDGRFGQLGVGQPGHRLSPSPSMPNQFSMSTPQRPGSSLLGGPAGGARPGPVDNVQVVNVTQQTGFGSFGSFLTSINKSVSSALNNISIFQPPPQQQNTSGGLRPDMRGPGQPGMMAGRAGFGPGRATSEGNVNGRSAPPNIIMSPAQQSLPISPSFGAARSRSPSPRRDIGFSGAVTNICDQAHTIMEEDRRHGSFRRKGRPMLSVVELCVASIQLPSILSGSSHTY